MEDRLVLAELKIPNPVVQDRVGDGSVFAVQRTRLTWLRMPRACSSMARLRIVVSTDAGKVMERAGRHAGFWINHMPTVVLVDAFDFCHAVVALCGVVERLPPLHRTGELKVGSSTFRRLASKATRARRAYHSGNPRIVLTVHVPAKPGSVQLAQFLVDLMLITSKCDKPAHVAKRISCVDASVFTRHGAGVSDGEGAEAGVVVVVVAGALMAVALVIEVGVGMTEAMAEAVEKKK